MARVKLSDIAKEAGVSVTAVSFFINGKAKQYNLSDATCRKIADAVQRHNFVPNIYARAIQGGCTYLIGFCVTDRLNHSFWSDIVAGMEELLIPERYHIILATNHHDGAGELEALKFMCSKGVDGCFVFSSPDEKGRWKNIDYLQEMNKTTPIVGINAALPGLASVYNDQSAGGRIAAELLLRHGHRRIALLGGGMAAERFAAFADLCRVHGIEPVFFSSSDALLLQRRNFSAVFCISDYVLLELYGKCAAAGINIPRELSVVGFDSMDFIKTLTPRPCSVSQHKKELGEAAASLMLSLIAGKEPDKQRRIVLLPQLFPGDSVITPA